MMNEVDNFDKARNSLFLVLILWGNSTYVTVWARRFFICAIFEKSKETVCSVWKNVFCWTFLKTMTMIKFFNYCTFKKHANSSLISSLGALDFLKALQKKTRLQDGIAKWSIWQGLLTSAKLLGVLNGKCENLWHGKTDIFSGSLRPF